jgi:hypothetical protein
LISDEIKNASQLPVGLINELLSEAISIRVRHAPWKFFGWTTVRLRYRDPALRWKTLSLSPRGHRGFAVKGLLTVVHNKKAKWERQFEDVQKTLPAT